MSIQIDSIKPCTAGYSQPADPYEFINLGYGMYPEGVNEALFREYLQLRAETYTRLDILNRDRRQDDGTETDEDDYRSQHFAVVRRRIGREATMTIVACSRLICKTEQRDAPLPIETFFEDVFTKNPVKVPSAEVSRVISLARRNGGNVLRRLFYTMADYHVKEGFLSSYAVVEEPLANRLRELGVPFNAVTEGEKIEKYNNSVNFGIKLDAPELLRQFGGQVVAAAKREDSLLAG